MHLYLYLYLSERMSATRHTTHNTKLGESYHRNS